MIYLGSTSCARHHMSQSSTCGLNPVRADRLLFSVQTSNLTVLRVFGTGADTSFQLTLQPGTAGADGKTWPNGMETLSLGRPTSPLRNARAASQLDLYRGTHSGIWTGGTQLSICDGLLCS